jgi:hypothetical protein
MVLFLVCAFSLLCVQAGSYSYAYCITSPSGESHWCNQEGQELGGHHTGHAVVSEVGLGAKGVWSGSLCMLGGIGTPFKQLNLKSKEKYVNNRKETV